MPAQQSDWQKALPILLLLALINCAPAILFHLGGDILTHLVMINCFSTQFWQGDLYPRWCMGVNSGLGAPLFFFYGPLPYYVTALLKPLGLTPYATFTKGYIIATIVTACACYSWLRDHATHKYALIGTAIFLFMPYRMEVMFYRSAYSEMWQIAFVPLLFKYTGRIARGEQRAMAPLALSLGLSLLAHVPCTLNCMLLTTLYLCAAGTRSFAEWRSYILAIIGGCALAAFYLVPGAIYHGFVHTEAMNNPELTWPNLYFRISTVTDLGLWRPALMTMLTLATLVTFSAVLWFKRAQFGQRKLVAWIVVAIGALCLLIPVSAPFYFLLGHFANFFFPWRMQIGFGIALTALATLWMQNLISEKRRKTLVADMGMLIAFMALMSYFQLNTYSGEEQDKFNAVIASEQITMPEYQPRATDNAHYSKNYMAQRYRNRSTTPKAVFVKGSGNVKVAQWEWSGIALDVTSDKPSTLRLDHLYFPAWEATASNGSAIALHAEEGSGQMLLGVPAGSEHVTIRRNLAAIAPFSISVSQWLSLAMAIALLFNTYAWRSMRRRKF